MSPSVSASLFAGVPSSMSSASENLVRQSSEMRSRLSVKRRANVLLDQTIVGERVVAFLRRRYPQKTAELVAADCPGLPAGTVQKWLDRGSAPNASGYTRLWLAYGPDFLAAIAPDQTGWLDQAVRAQRAAELKTEIAALEAKLAGVRP